MSHNPGLARPLRVCFFGTFREEYTRNVFAIQALQSAGVEVVVCHQPLWLGADDRVQVASGGWFTPNFFIRAVKAYWSLIRKYATIGRYDVMMVGYPGHLDIFLGRLLTWLRRAPLAWEVVISLYLILLERGIAEQHQSSAFFIKLLEKTAVRLPDLLFLDSSAFIEWFKNTHAAPVKKFSVLPLGVDADDLPSVLNRLSNIDEDYEDKFLVIYYGSFIPNHGVPTIVEAARILQDEPEIHFELIGDGPSRTQAEAYARQHDLQNVTFIDWLDKEQLVAHLHQASVCLGSLGDTLQGQLTNNNKILEAFSLGIPVVTGVSSALPDELVDRKHLYLCPRGDPVALAEAVLELKSNSELRCSLAENGKVVLEQHFNLPAIGQLLADFLNTLVRKAG